MFSWFLKKNKKSTADHDAPVTNWSFLRTDIHSHFIPGIDDGAQTIDDSLNLITAMRDMGFRSLVTTPHIKFDHYPNTRETIETGLRELRQALKANHIDIPIKAAAEYYIDDHFMQLLESEPLLTIQNNEVLVELSFMFEPLNFYNLIFKIQTRGYKPILAHPERYAFYHEKKEVFQELKDRGVLLQLNTIALTGYYGKPVKDMAEYLLEKGFYDYCGSDMHHLRHAEQLRKLLNSKIIHNLERYPFKNNKIQIA
jgi:tyrosine-protein phosphatase YwqE